MLWNVSKFAGLLRYREEARELQNKILIMATVFYFMTAYFLMKHDYGNKEKMHLWKDDLFCRISAVLNIYCSLNSYMYNLFFGVYIR